MIICITCKSLLAGEARGRLTPTIPLLSGVVVANRQTYNHVIQFINVLISYQARNNKPLKSESMN